MGERKSAKQLCLNLSLRETMMDDLSGLTAHIRVCIEVKQSGIESD
jgi:hypothetical protein